MIALLATVVIVMLLSLSLIGLMYTDVTHASIQHAVARSFYVAQAGLEEARIHVEEAPDPAAYTTPAGGVTAAFGSGQFTYWVDAGPATDCGAGLKTLEAVGQVAYLRWSFSTRVRACGVPGTPFLAALFGVSSIEFQGMRSRTYIAPSQIGTPGGGASIGSFTEIDFADNEVRVNALSERVNDMVTVRDGTIFDYALFGFPARPDYTSNPATDPTPWILSAFGDLVKAQPTTGVLGSPCGTAYGCVTVANRKADIPGVTDLRAANYLPHVYMRDMRKATWPPLALDPGSFRRLAARNTANAAINSRAGLQNKTDAVYAEVQFNQIIFYLSNHPGEVLHGTVYVDGTLHVLLNVSLGGNAGDVTLGVRGDLIIHRKRTLTNRHDRSAVAGRRTPGIVVFGSAALSTSATPCGSEAVNGSGRLVVCDGASLVVDGLVYTQDGMVLEPGALVDQVGAMYHNNRGTANPSFINRDATLVLRFDPLALSVFGQGLATLSWQQLR